MIDALEASSICENRNQSNLVYRLERSGGRDAIRVILLPNSQVMGLMLYMWPASMDSICSLA